MVETAYRHGVFFHQIALALAGTLGCIAALLFPPPARGILRDDLIIEERDGVNLRQRYLEWQAQISLPSDCGIIFSDVFYDGFDGCHMGNFTSWDVNCGRWAVRRPQAQHAYFENALVGESDESAMIVYPAADWSHYSLHVAVKTTAAQDPRTAAGVLFGLQAPNHFYLLKWQFLEGSDQTEVQLSRQADGKTELLGTAQAICPPDTWHEIQIVLETEAIHVRLDNTGLLEQPVDDDIVGGIGLLVEGKTMVYFDDVHVRTVTEIAGSHFRNL